MAERKEEEWETVYRETPLQQIPWQAKKPPKKLVELVASGKLKPGRALDVCCGSGLQAVYLAKKGFKVTGIDISETAVKIAKERAEKEKVEAEFLAGDVLPFRFKKNEFDFVLDRGCFHHIEPKDKPAFIKGLARVLKPKGLYLLYAFSDKNTGWRKNLSKEGLRNYFSKDFEVISMGEIVHVQPAGEKVWLHEVVLKRKQS